MTSENVREEQHNCGKVRGLRSKLADFILIGVGVTLCSKKGSDCYWAFCE